MLAVICDWCEKVEPESEAYSWSYDNEYKLDFCSDVCREGWWERKYKDEQ